jgi:hypothetical protein
MSSTRKLDLYANLHVDTEAENEMVSEVQDGINGLMMKMIEQRMSNGNWQALLYTSDGHVDLDMPLTGWPNGDKIAILTEKLSYARAQTQAQKEAFDEEMFKLRSIICGLITRATPAASTSHPQPLHVERHTVGAGHTEKATHVHVELPPLSSNPQDWDLNAIALNLHIDSNCAHERDAAVFRRIRDDVLSGRQHIDGTLYTEVDILALENKVAGIVDIVNSICAANVGASLGDSVHIMTATTQFGSVEAGGPHGNVRGLSTATQQAPASTLLPMMVSMPATTKSDDTMDAVSLDAQATSPILNYQYSVNPSLDEFNDEDDDFLSYPAGYTDYQARQTPAATSAVAPAQITQLRPLTASLTLSKDKSLGTLVGRLRPFSSSQQRVSASLDIPSDRRDTDGFETGLSKKMKILNVAAPGSVQSMLPTVRNGLNTTLKPLLASNTGGKSFADSHTRSGWRKVESDLRRERGLNTVKQKYDLKLADVQSRHAALTQIAPVVTPFAQAAASLAAVASGNDCRKIVVNQTEVIPLRPRSASPTDLKQEITQVQSAVQTRTDQRSQGNSYTGFQKRTQQMLDQLNNSLDIIQSRILFGIRPLPEILARAEWSAAHSVHETKEASQQSQSRHTVTSNCYEELCEVATKQHRLREVCAVSHRQRENEILTFAGHLNTKINKHIRAVQQLEAQLLQLGNAYYDNRTETMVKAAKHYELKA